MMRGLLISAFCFLCGSVFPQFSFDTIFSRNPLLKKISRNKDNYHLQIIFTQIERRSTGLIFTAYSYNVKPENYVYCASLVKLPVSILALQKLNEINVPMDAVMFTDSSRTCQFKVDNDTSSASKLPSIEQYIKRMFLVSDNFSYSRVYEFLGVDYIHKKLRACNFPDVRIINRYDGNCTGKDNFITNPVTFMSQDLKVIYKQPEQVSAGYGPVLKDIKLGKAYYTLKNKRINAPKDFTYSNYMTLKDCDLVLRELIFNEKHSFNISEEQREFLKKYLSLYPRQSNYPNYNPKEYYDSYKKYLIHGDSKNTISDTNLVVTNIVGQSYGFMSDCAYVYDKKNKIEFMLSAAIYANEDEVLNDGKYDYKTVALPYLAELGRQIHKYVVEQKAIKK